MAPKRAASERPTKAAASSSAKTAAAKPRGRPAGVKKETTEKKPAASKKATETKKPEAKANTSKKRKAEADVEEKAPAKKQKQAVETKKTKTTTKVTTKKTAVKESKATKAPKPVGRPRAKTPKPAPAPKPKKPKVVINTAPTTQLDVFAFGTNSNAELGMGDTFKKADCPRPKYNTVLSNAGVVQISAGGMHGIALTHDNKVLTWGVNDQGALGRDTNWDGGLVDMDKAQEESDSDDEEEIEVNPKEATPTEIDLSGVESGTIFTQVVAADSASFALTDDGFVYGWGTFRVSFL